MLNLRSTPTTAKGFLSPQSKKKLKIYDDQLKPFFANITNCAYVIMWFKMKLKI